MINYGQHSTLDKYWTN